MKRTSSTRSARLRLAGVALALATTMTACSAPAPEANQGELDENYETTIKIMEYEGTEPFQAVDEMVTQLLKDKFPKVTLEYEYIDPETLTQRITTGIAGGDPPDVIAYFPGPDFIKLARAGTLMSLSPFIKSDPEMERIAGIWEATVPPDQYSFDGQTYGFTVDLGPLSMWSWQDELEAAGLDGPPSTLDELVDTAQAIRASGGQPMAVGMSTETIWEIDYTFNALVANFDDTGAESKARLADRGALSYEDPAFRSAVELFAELHTEGVFNDAVLEQSYQTDAKNDWSTKTVSMFWPSGPWMVGTTADDTTGDINVTSWPTVSGDIAVLSGADKVFAGLAATDRQKQSAHQSLIAEIVKLYMSPDVQAEYYAQGLFPVDVSVATGASADDPWGIILDKQIQMVADADRIVDYATYTPEHYSAITQGIQALLLGTGTVDEVIDGLVAAQLKAYPCAPGCP